MRSMVDSFNIGTSSITANSKDYYELSSSGLAYLGKYVPQVALSYPALGGSVTFPAQSIVASSKIYDPALPLHYNDADSAKNITLTYNMTLSAPLLGLNNTPGTQKTTVSYTDKAIGWGKLQLKGYTDPLDVVVVKRTYTTTLNYFIAGSPAPAALLTVIGLTDGATDTTTTYEFFSTTIGYAGEITLNSTGTAVAEATFRRNF